MRSSPPPSKTNTTSSRTRPDWSIPTTSQRLGSSSSSRGREFSACSYVCRTGSSEPASHAHMSTDADMSLEAMGQLSPHRANRVRTARDPLGGSTLHQCRQRLLIQAHRHSDARPLPHWRAPRTRRRQIRQVIPAFGLISPRLNLLITDGDSTKKTLAHTNNVYENRWKHRRLSHH